MVNIMSKRSEITQRQQSENYQSISSKDLAAWASNHNGWSKMKKKNRKKFKKKFRDESRKEVEKELEEL